MKRRHNTKRRRHSARGQSVLAGLLRPELLEARCLLAATTIQLTASNDTTIYDVNAGDLSNGAGEFLLAGGPLGQSGVRRGIVYFDVSSVRIPDGATIVDVVLSMHLSQTQGGTASVSVNRVLSPWGEAGSDAPGSEIEGDAAQQFDATWLFSFFDGSAWDNPGGDFAGASASQVVGDVGTYEWFGGDLIADVQAWLDRSVSNYGWMIIGNESAGSNKSFDSRNSANAVLRPTLEITYEESALPGIVEGRKWNDLNGDGLRVSAVVDDLNLEAWEDNYYYNAFGGQEYWYRSTNDGTWFFLTQSSELIQWNGLPGQLNGQSVAVLDSRVYHNVDGLVDGSNSPEPFLNGFTFELLDQFGTVVATTDSRDIDLDQSGSINEETERGWYRFENVEPGTYTVREVQQAGWVQSASRTSPLAEQAYDLTSSLGLRMAGSLYTDYGGAGEKWLKADSGWYYIVPTGALFKWDGVPISSTQPLSGTLTSDLGIPYFRDPSLVYAAVDPEITVSSGLTTGNIDFGNYQPAVISGRKWSDRNPDGIRNPPELKFVDGSDGSGEGDGDGGIYYSNADGGEFFIDREGNVFRVAEDGSLIYVTSMSGAATQNDNPGEWIFFEEPWLNGFTFELLDEDGNVIDSSTSSDRDLDDSGTIEPEEETGWYLFDNVVPGTYTVREVQQTGWIQTAPASPEYAETVRQLNNQYGFKAASNDYFDFGERDERWLQGRNDEWYFITPDGRLYEWNRNSGGTNGPAQGTFVARLSSSFYLNPLLLTNPVGTTVSVLSNEAIDNLNFGNHKVEEGLFSRLADELLGNL
jgi:hypothetical protein